jgi:hypothetical protein
MNRPQRVVSILYCLAVVYCCVWVPWHVITPEAGETQLGYTLLWHVDWGGPNIATIAVRIIAVTALSAAAFLIFGNWRARR